MSDKDHEERRRWNIGDIILLALLVVALALGAVGYVASLTSEQRSKVANWLSGRESAVEVKLVGGAREVFFNVKVTYQGPVVELAGLRMERKDKNHWVAMYREMAFSCSQITEVVKLRPGTPEFDALVGEFAEDSMAEWYERENKKYARKPPTGQ